MKKILFNDKFGLTQAVLDGRKTNTRRLSTFTLHEGDLRGELTQVYPDEIFTFGDKWFFKYKGQVYHLPKENYPKYKVGEIVAIAQSYETIQNSLPYSERSKFYCDVMKAHFPNSATHKDYYEIAGWHNKMFVKAELMPRRIQMTNLRVERLQDISDEDCLKEGIERLPDGGGYKPYAFYDSSLRVKSGKEGVHYGGYRDFDTPREAFASLIDKVGKKGDWGKNPYVLAYDFELVK